MRWVWSRQAGETTGMAWFPTLHGMHMSSTEQMLFYDLKPFPSCFWEIINRRGITASPHLQKKPQTRPALFSKP